MKRKGKPSREEAAPAHRAGTGQQFEPVTFGDLAEAGVRVSVHCRTCGHWSRLNPSILPLAADRAVPSADGAFRCTRCGSRDSCAMPHYPRKSPG